MRYRVVIFSAPNMGLLLGYGGKRFALVTLFKQENETLKYKCRRIQVHVVKNDVIMIECLFMSITLLSRY